MMKPSAASSALVCGSPSDLYIENWANGAVHIEATHDADWYLNTPDIHNDPRWYRLGNIRTEVYNTLGLVNFDPTTRVAVYPIARFDGHVGANFGGAWTGGDDHVFGLDRRSWR